jgi:hypothetical protein
MPAPNGLRQTHTVALLEVSQEVYDDIREKLEAAGYLRFDDPVEMTMQGIALVPAGYEEGKPEPAAATSD